MYIFEGASGLSDGITVNAINSNRNSANTSNLIIKVGTTVTENGTKIYAVSRGLDGVTPAKASQLGIVSRENELILKRNTAYLFVFTSRGADNVVSYCGEWYERKEKN